MLGLILIYWIGKYYFELAKRFQKKKWLYALLGVATFYVGTFIFGIILGLYAYLSGNFEILEKPDIVIELIALPFGILACWGLYKLIKNNLEKNSIVDTNEDVLDENIS